MGSLSEGGKYTGTRQLFTSETSGEGACYLREANERTSIHRVRFGGHLLEKQEAEKVEIIEIGAVKINEKLEVVDDFCSFVRPKLHPEISPFCTKLTSIVQDDIEDAPMFDEAIELFEDWVGFSDTRSVLMSWGNLTAANSTTTHSSTTWTCRGCGIGHACKGIIAVGRDQKSNWPKECHGNGRPQF